mgnify:CR=1 FL=1
MSNSTQLAHSLLRQLIETGVSDFVVCPGSRNAPFLIALGEASSKQIVDLHIKIDERGAAFFALGIAKASNNYVAVICTSGTAAANFHPAALEALHSNSKLLIITADRPARLRKTGANQTTNQVDIFSSVKTHDLSTDINLKPLLTNGPLHLNVQFDEPLISEEKNDWLAGIKITGQNYSNKIGGRLDLTTGVLIVGHDRAGYTLDEINDFAGELNWPVISEDPISFPQAIAHSSLFLTDPKNVDVRYGQSIIKSFVTGSPGLPRKGVAALSNALAARVKNITYRTQVDTVENGMIHTSAGTFTAKKVVIATDATTATQILGLPEVPRMAGCITWYHAVDSNPSGTGRLVVDGQNRGPIINTIVVWRESGC